MRLKSFSAVQKHTGILLNSKNEKNNRVTDKRGLCQYIDRHKK